MNYIKHLTHWFELLKSNEEVKPSHIAMYITLFQMWNQNRFIKSFIINRPELMTLCKMGSKTSYSNCMSDMHRWGWLHYTPSNSKYGSSTVTPKNWSYITKKNDDKDGDSKTSSDTSSGTSTYTTRETSTGTSRMMTTGQEQGHNNKTYKQQTDNNKELNNFKKNYHEPM